VKLFRAKPTDWDLEELFQWSLHYIRRQTREFFKEGAEIDMFFMSWFAAQFFCYKAGEFNLGTSLLGRRLFNEFLQTFGHLQLDEEPLDEVANEIVETSLQDANLTRTKEYAVHCYLRLQSTTSFALSKEQFAEICDFTCKSIVFKLQERNFIGKNEY
jgi:hypothetical protein